MRHGASCPARRSLPWREAPELPFRDTSHRLAILIQWIIRGGRCLRGGGQASRRSRRTALRTLMRHGASCPARVLMLRRESCPPPPFASACPLEYSSSSPADLDSANNDAGRQHVGGGGKAAGEADISSLERRCPMPACC